MFAEIGSFFSKWFARLRAFAMLAGAWGVLFSVITLAGFRIGFEYDDGIVFSANSFKAAGKSGFEAGSADYWNALNRAYRLERVKPVPWLTAWAFRSLGFKVDFFSNRGAEGSDSLQNSWKALADRFNFTPDENKKYELLERGGYLFYFTPSDEGVIQARKAGVAPVRILKSKKSPNPCLYSPGKFKERSLPLSEF